MREVPLLSLSLTAEGDRIQESKDMVTGKDKNKGLTMVELVIVMAIIAIGALLFSPSLGVWVAHYRVRTAARDMVSIMRVAQMKAVSNNYKYRVKIDTGAGTYVLEKNTGIDYFSDGSAGLKVPAGITISSSGNPEFKPDSLANTGSINLQGPKETKKIEWFATGRVTVK